MKGRPNNTTHAILGLLAMRDWAAYELTKEMRRNLRFFWPRAESAVYVELRKLHKAGLATTRVERSGRRETTIYSITGRGRKELKSWLDQAPRRGVQLESEGMLQIFSAASLGPAPETIGAGIAAIEEDATELIERSLSVGGEYLEGTAPFQHQLRWRVFSHVFIAQYGLMLDQWCRWARAELDRWESSDEETVKSNATAAIAAIRKQLEPAAQPRGEGEDSA